MYALGPILGPLTVLCQCVIDRHPRFILSKQNQSTWDSNGFGDKLELQAYLADSLRRKLQNIPFDWGVPFDSDTHMISDLKNRFMWPKLYLATI
jgi:hypothetical protein